MRGKGSRKSLTQILSQILEDLEMRYLVFLILIAIVAIWLIQRAHHDQINQVTDYTTGKTQTNILIEETVNIRRIEIQQAVRLFEGMNARAPRSLDELVQEGLLSEEQKYIRYANVKYEIESGLTPDGRLFIRGAGKDRIKGTKDDWEFIL
jgi:hypothetical protein